MTSASRSLCERTGAVVSGRRRRWRPSSGQARTARAGQRGGVHAGRVADAALPVHPGQPGAVGAVHPEHSHARCAWSISGHAASGRRGPSPHFPGPCGAARLGLLVADAVVRRLLSKDRPERTVRIMAGTKKRLVWQGITAGSAALAVVVTRHVLGFVWRRVRGEPPPDGPADRKVTWAAALTWAMAMGVGIAVARVVAVRLSAEVWEAATHEAPPDTT